MNTTRQLYCDERAPRVRFVPRMSHTTDPLGESEAHEQLLGMFASELLTSVPRRAVEIARRLLKADAAGLHLCRSDARTAIQHRDLICGDLSALEAADTGMGQSLCKMCLAAGTTVVLSQQELELTLLRNIRPRLIHLMMVPLYDSAKSPIGILWLGQITSAATYSRADTLILARFAHVLVLGLKLLADAQERETLAAKIEVERKAHAETLQLLRAARAQTQVADTGRGWAVGSGADTFSLSLVHKLAEQLGATLEIRKPDSGPGTMITLIIPGALDVDSVRADEHQQDGEISRSHSAEVTDRDSER
jgi:hypothetical protein